MIKAQTLKGFRDFLPAEARKRQYVVNKLKATFESFGFEPLETPALEYEEILLGKYGTEGDKLMYRFTDNGGRKVALRYDQTVPLARVVAEYSNQLPLPFKRYQIQPVWRAENTQKGRFREFLQCDIDTVGSSSPLSDAEIIACTVKSFEALGFSDFKILINDRSILNVFAVEEVRIIDKIEKIGIDGVINKLVEKNLESKDTAEKKINDLKSIQPPESIKQVMDNLSKLGVDNSKVEFSPTLARGLDYYTGIILEVKVEGYEAGSGAGGGRYDNLIGLFAGKNIPAVGVAFGFDRIIEAMDQLNLFPVDLITTKVLVTIFSKELEQKSIEISSFLRSNNITCELWLDAESKLDKQLKYADQKGIPYVIIIGPEEAGTDKITLKDLKSNSQDKLITLDAAIQKLTS